MTVSCHKRMWLPLTRSQGTLLSKVDKAQFRTAHNVLTLYKVVDLNRSHTDHRGNRKFCDNLCQNLCSALLRYSSI